MNGTTTQIPDERPYGQRVHDGLDEACARLLTMGDQPVSGGTPTSVILTIGLQELLTKAGLAETSDGSTLTSDQLLRIADEAEIWPTIINHHNIPLAMGRTRRIATPGQTMALHIETTDVRSPGVPIHPYWCDRHHIQDWILGGPTDLDNLTLLCRYHHTHFLQKGWTCRINSDRSTGMDTAVVDRPTSTTPTQHPHPTPPRPTPTRTSAATTRRSVKSANGDGHARRNGRAVRALSNYRGQAAARL